MSLSSYVEPVPCYQTKPIEMYQSGLIREARNVFQLVRRYANADCKQQKGSFSIKTRTTKETSAKIVIYQNGVGSWSQDDPVWSDGVYVWIRANGHPGEAFAMAAQAPNFAHRWVLNRLARNRAVSVKPNQDRHFYYFRMNDNDDRTQIAQLLAFCSTL